MTVSTRGDKTICLPVANEAQYREFMADNQTYRAYIEQIRAIHPEIFPLGLEKGFCFHDQVFSVKQKLSMRRIKLKENEAVYQLRERFRHALHGGKN